MFQDTSSITVVQTRCQATARRALVDITKCTYGRIRANAQTGIASKDPIATLEQIRELSSSEVIKELCDDTLVSIRLTLGLAKESRAVLLEAA